MSTAKSGPAHFWWWKRKPFRTYSYLTEPHPMVETCHKRRFVRKWINCLQSEHMIFSATQWPYVDLRVFGQVSFNYICPFKRVKCLNCTMGSQDIYLFAFHSTLGLPTNNDQLIIISRGNVIHLCCVLQQFPNRKFHLNNNLSFGTKMTYSCGDILIYSSLFWVCYFLKKTKVHPMVKSNIMTTLLPSSIHFTIVPFRESQWVGHSWSESNSVTAELQS